MARVEPETGGFRRQRRTGMIAIAAAMPVTLLLWLAIAYLPPPLAGMDGLGARMLFTLKCWCLAVLFCLVTGVEAVAHERLSSPAFDPLSGFETRRLHVNLRYLQNTLEQTAVFSAAIFGLAAYSQGGLAMRAVVATTIVWIVARFAFWIGYHRSAALRGLGAPGRSSPPPPRGRPRPPRSPRRRPRPTRSPSTGPTTSPGTVTPGSRRPAASARPRRDTAMGSRRFIRSSSARCRRN